MPPTRNQTFRRSGVWKDIDINFQRNPLTNDVATKSDRAAVAQSIRNLVLTAFGERPFQPNVGSNVRSLLFEPADSITIQSIRNEIRQTVANFEPRAQIVNITVSDDLERNAYAVSITYRLNELDDPVEVDVVLQRLR